MRIRGRGRGERIILDERCLYVERERKSMRTWNENINYKYLKISRKGGKNYQRLRGRGRWFNVRGLKLYNSIPPIPEFMMADLFE